MASAAPVALLDTCAILDAIRAPVRDAIPSAVVDAGIALTRKATETPRALWPVVVEDVWLEYDAHRSTVTAEVERDIAKRAARIEQLRATASVLAPEFTWQPTELDRMRLHTRLHTAADALVGASLLLAHDTSLMNRAARRVMAAHAPSAKGKDELRDCLIVEQYLALATALRASGFSQPIFFLSSNSTDYGAAPRARAPLDGEFVALGIEFVSNLAWLLSVL
jgi:hypothetical protein